VNDGAPAGRRAGPVLGRGPDPAWVPDLRHGATALAGSRPSEHDPDASLDDEHWVRLVASIRNHVRTAVETRREHGAPVGPEDRAALAEEAVAEWLRVETEHRIRRNFPPPQPWFADRLRAEVRAAVSELGFLTRFLDAARWSDVEVNGGDSVVCTERGTGRRTAFSSPFTSDAEVFDWVAEHAANAGRRFDESSPSVRFRLPNGVRVHAIGRVTSRTHIDFRLWQSGLDSLDSLASAGMFDADVGRLLAASAAVRDPIGVIISGGTGVGKTTLLRAWMAAHPDPIVLDRVVTVEDEQELLLDRTRFVNLVEFEAREPNVDGKGEYSMERYLSHDLRRQTPTRVALGELKPDGGVMPLLLALGQGIAQGVATTIHAPSDADVLPRIRTYAAYGSRHLPESTVLETVAASVDLVVHVARVAGRRMVVSVREYGDYRDGVTSAQLWAYSRAAGRAVRTDVEASEQLAAKLIAGGLEPAVLERNRTGWYP
jgi:pilus assembly protein CpaF